MDDILESCKSPEEGHQLIKEIKEILINGGFEMKDWITSKTEKEKVENNSDASGKSISSERVLGLEWNQNTDVLHFKAKLNFSEKRRKLFVEPNLKRWR